MKKTAIMLAGFAVLFSTAIACFTPSSKKDKSSTVNENTEEVSEENTEAN
jgi:hypothetical protein